MTCKNIFSSVNSKNCSKIKYQRKLIKRIKWMNGRCEKNILMMAPYGALLLFVWLWLTLVEAAFFLSSNLCLWMHLDKISDLLFSSFLGGHSAMANFSSRQSLHDLPPLNGGALAQIDHLILKCLLDFFNFQIYLERAVWCWLFSFLNACLCW